uniref:Uncharacterized protein n=1 Tax=Athene cunicularia TaxID=194338 RepID=A0A663MV98_ATHCN
MVQNESLNCSTLSWGRVCPLRWQRGRPALQQPCCSGPRAHVARASFWSTWLIPIFGALVIGLMYRYYMLDGRTS